MRVAWRVRFGCRTDGIHDVYMTFTWGKADGRRVEKVGVPYESAWGNVRYPHDNGLGTQLSPMCFPSVYPCNDIGNS